MARKDIPEYRRVLESNLEKATTVSARELKGCLDRIPIDDHGPEPRRPPRHPVGRPATWRRTWSTRRANSSSNRALNEVYIRTVDAEREDALQRGVR